MTSRDEVWTSDSSAYLRPQNGVDAWTAEAETRGSVGTQRLLRVAPTHPSPAVGRALGLQPGSPAVLRLRLIELDGHPVELAGSWYPEDIAAGTGLAADKKIPGGAVTLLANLGHRIDSVVEDVESRLPTDDEATKLRIARQDPVLVLTRLARDQDGHPVEVSVMVTPGSQRRLRYEMKVH